MSMKNAQNFKTSDMWLAATLMALGELMIDVEHGSGPRAYFVFARTSSLEVEADDYRAGRLRIEPQSLFVQTKLIKARLYQ